MATAYIDTTYPEMFSTNKLPPIPGLVPLAPLIPNSDDAPPPALKPIAIRPQPAELLPLAQPTELLPLPQALKKAFPKPLPKPYAEYIYETALSFLRADPQKKDWHSKLSLTVSIPQAKHTTLPSEPVWRLKIQKDITPEEYRDHARDIIQHPRRDLMHYRHWQYFHTPRLAPQEVAFANAIAQEAFYILCEKPISERAQTFQLCFTVMVRGAKGRKRINALFSVVDEYNMNPQDKPSK